MTQFKIGDFVEKSRGDYHFRGWVVSTFYKRGGEATKVVVENEDRILDIFSPDELEFIEDRGGSEQLV